MFSCYCVSVLTPPQWLVAAGRPPTAPPFSPASLLQPGSTFSWAVVAAGLAWSFLSLRVPAKQFSGPPTPLGYIPVYSANGVTYYFARKCPVN